MAVAMEAIDCGTEDWGRRPGRESACPYGDLHLLGNQGEGGKAGNTREEREGKAGGCF